MAIRKFADGLPENIYTCNSKGIDKDTFCITKDEEFKILEELATAKKTRIKPST